MSVWAPKRFWKMADVVAAEHGFAVALDGRAIRTPAKTAFWVPTEALAQQVAAEWQAQADKVRPETMPFTRMANSALDKVAPQHGAVADMLAAYGGSDLLCYRAEAPRELQELQAEAWDPVLDWARETLHAPLIVTQGVMPVAQDRAALAAFSVLVHDFTSFQLAAFHDLVAITGSLVLAFAVVRGRLDVDAAFAASRIDEAWQAKLWGTDEEAAESEALKLEALRHAAHFWRLCG